MSEFPNYVKVANTAMSYYWYFKHIDNGLYEEVFVADYLNCIKKLSTHERKTIIQLLDYSEVDYMTVTYLTEYEFNVEIAIYIF